MLYTEQDLERLVRAYQDPLMRYCTGLLGSQQDAQDAVQTTFIKAWEKRQSLRNEAAMKSWLYRIAYRTAVDLLRRRPAETELPDDLEAPEKDPGLSEELEQALNRLKPLDRAILEEHLLEEMTYEEISRIHHLPQTTIRARVSRAKKRLRSLLGETKEEVS